MMGQDEPNVGGRTPALGPDAAATGPMVGCLAKW